MAAQAPGDVREDDVAVVELDGKGRAGEDLLDAAEDLDRRFLRFLRGLGGFGRTRTFSRTSLAWWYRTLSSTRRQASDQTLIS